MWVCGFAKYLGGWVPEIPPPPPWLRKTLGGFKATGRCCIQWLQAIAPSHLLPKAWDDHLTKHPSIPKYNSLYDANLAKFWLNRETPSLKFYKNLLEPPSTFKTDTVFFAKLNQIAMEDLKTGTEVLPLPCEVMPPSDVDSQTNACPSDDVCVCVRAGVFILHAGYPGLSERTPTFLWLRTAPKDHQPPTANRHQPPSANRQPPPASNASKHGVGRGTTPPGISQAPPPPQPTQHEGRQWSALAAQARCLPSTSTSSSCTRCHRAPPAPTAIALCHAAPGRAQHRTEA